MIRSYKYRLYPTGRQGRELHHALAVCRRLYNAALEERIGAWRKAHRTITYVDQTRSLTEIRAFDEEYAALPVCMERSALRRLDKAYKAFFRRIKSGGKPGFPRFRGRDRYDSFGIGRVKILASRVIVPKIGHVKLKLSRPLVGKTLDVNIKFQCGRWYVVFQQDVGPCPAKIAVRNAVGIDLGLKTYIHLSDDTTVENPRHLCRGEAALARAQRVLARKKRGSANRLRAKRRVARSHERILNQRSDFHWKVARQMVTTYDLIVHEDLNIKGLAQSNLAKSIHDAGWSSFLHKLNCKAEEAGKTVVAVDPRNTTQACSGCGAVVRKGLTDRRHDCPNCGLSLDRDHNAALNILRLGKSLLHSEGSTC